MLELIFNSRGINKNFALDYQTILGWASINENSELSRQKRQENNQESVYKAFEVSCLEDQPRIPHGGIKF